jgi:hypothetical protein
MSTLNVGAMAARLGLDSSEFLDKMKGVQGFNGFVTGEMSRQFKQTSRDGAEAFRTLDEMMGIHLNRPMTRLLVETFPSFAKGLQSILGGVAFGAVAYAATELFDRVSQTIEKARKIEEEFTESSRKATTMFGESMGAYEKGAKLRSLSGIDKEIFKVDSSSLTEASKRVDVLSVALQKNAKDALEASSPWNEFWAAVGSKGHQVFSLSSTLGVEAIDKQMQALREHLQDIAVASQADPLRGLHLSLTATQAEFDKADAALKKMTADQIAAAAVRLVDPESGVDFSSAAAPSGKETAAQQKYLDNLRAMLDLLKAAAKDNAGAENEVRKADAAERQLKAQEAITALYKTMASSLAKLQPETDPIKKLDAEIGEFRRTAVADFAEIGRSAASALATRAALAGLDSYEKKLDTLKTKLEGDILAKQAFELFKEPLAGIGRQTPSAGFELNKPPVTAAIPPTIPTLGAGGLAGAQFDTFAKDQTAQLKLAAQAYADAESPQQKYKLGEQELDLLLQKGLINTNAYTAALAQLVDLRSRSSAKQGLTGSIDELNPSGAKMQELQQRMASLRGMQATGVGLDGTKLDAGDLTAVRLEMQAIEEEENKILLKTGDVNAGFRAWGIEIQKVASAGEVTFEALGQASKGFEDAASNSLMAIMTAQRDQHQKLINELDKMWSQYFDGLAKMGMKRGMDQLLAPLGKVITGGFAGTPQQPGAPALPPTAPGSATGLGAFFPKPNAAVGLAEKDVMSSVTGKSVSGAAGGASLTSAGTMLQSAATALLSAATALRASGAGGLGSSGPFSSAGGGAGDAADAGAAIPFFAEGGDATPGSSFISGEAGAEKVDLDRSGGAHITPLGFSTKGSGDTHVYQDFTGAVVSDDLMRRAEGAAMIHQSQKQMMGAMPAMQREINLRKRGG